MQRAPANASFEEVVDALSPLMFHMARRRMEQLHLADADEVARDVVQTTWLNIWRAWDRLERDMPKGRDAYILRALERTAIDAARVAIRLGRYLGASLDAPVHSPVGEDEATLGELLRDPNASETRLAAAIDNEALMARLRVYLRARTDSSPQWASRYVALVLEGASHFGATRLIHPEMSGVVDKTARDRTRALRADLAAYLQRHPSSSQ